MRKAFGMLLVIVVVSVGFLMVADWLHLSLFATVLIAVGGALVCLFGFVVFPIWQRRNSHREFQEMMYVGRDTIVGKARYRDCRILHYSDGSVAAQTKRGMRSFRSFDACRRFIDGR
jgi:hypothetical protein